MSELDDKVTQLRQEAIKFRQLDRAHADACQKAKDARAAVDLQYSIYETAQAELQALIDPLVADDSLNKAGS